HYRTACPDCWGQRIDLRICETCTLVYFLESQCTGMRSGSGTSRHTPFVLVSPIVSGTAQSPRVRCRSKFLAVPNVSWHEAQWACDGVIGVLQHLSNCLIPLFYHQPVAVEAPTLTLVPQR